MGLGGVAQNVKKQLDINKERDKLMEKRAQEIRDRDNAQGMIDARSIRWDEDLAKRRQRRSTLLTGPLGLTGNANVSQKTLLGS